MWRGEGERGGDGRGEDRVEGEGAESGCAGAQAPEEGREEEGPGDGAGDPHGARERGEDEELAELRSAHAGQRRRTNGSAVWTCSPRRCGGHVPRVVAQRGGRERCLERVGERAGEREDVEERG